MDSFILPLLLGIFCIVLGAYNIKGHIGEIIALAGIIIGLIISLHAVAKYNKGVF